MNPVRLLGVGTSVPPHRIEQPDAARFASWLSAHDEEQARRVAVLYRRAGVRGRHMVVLDKAPEAGDGPEELQRLFQPAVAGDTAGAKGPTTGERMSYYAERAAPLAERAARAALADADVEADAITHLVTISCTGFMAPGVDIALIGRLGLNPGVERAHIGFMGCQGALNGLRVARALASASAAHRVLLCAVELCGLHLQYVDEPDLIVANSLFADGASAAVIGSRDDAANDRWTITAHGSTLIPESLDAMTWTIGDHGFTMTLSARVPGLIESNLRAWMETWLTTQGLRVEDVGSWAIHPGGARIISAVEKSLAIDPATSAASREVLACYGNMSSPTVLFVMQRLIAAQAPTPCVALAFGPGLSAEATLFS